MPPRRLGAWFALMAVLALGLLLAIRYAPQIVPYITAEVAG